MLTKGYATSIIGGAWTRCTCMTSWSLSLESTFLLPTFSSLFWNKLGSLLLNCIQIVGPWFRVSKSFASASKSLLQQMPSFISLLLLVPMCWLSFQAHTNQKVFLLYEESFHRCKPFYFKVFRASKMVSCWETLEGELKINCFRNKNFEIPRVNEAYIQGTSCSRLLFDKFWGGAS